MTCADAVPRSVRDALLPDDALAERTVSSQSPWACPIFRVEDDVVALSDGSEGRRFIVRHGGGVGVIAVRDGLLCLVRQYRLPLGRVTLEIPAGRLEAGEEPVSAAARELAEETGLAAARMEPVLTVYGSPGFTSEHTDVFCATGLTQGASHPDDGEVVRVVWLPVEDVVAAICSGAIRDGKTVSGVLAARAKGMLE